MENETQGLGAEDEATTIQPTASADALFASVMDTIAPEAYGEEDEAGGKAAAPSGDGAGQPAAPDEGAGSGAEPAAPPAAGDGGVGGVPNAGDGDGAEPGRAEGNARPASWTLSAQEIEPKWGEMSTALEKNAHDEFIHDSLEEVKSEYPKHFDALSKHPRLLVGQQVPRLDGQEGMETLRDSADAKEWQEALKGVLFQEVQDRASRRSDESSEMMSLIHNSIDLFKNNADLVPGTKDFDVELANKFAEFAKDYEMRVEGKLLGYSVPVQPLINQLRTSLTAERAAAKANPPAPATPAKPVTPAGNAGTQVDGPQAGIPSKQGDGSDPADNFDTLFNTLGLSGFRI